MKKKLRHLVAGGIATGGMLAFATTAFAGGKVDFGPDQFVTVGGGLRTSLSATENGAPDGSTSYDANLDSIRLYIGGQIMKGISFTFNTEYDGNGDIQVLDAIGQISFSDYFNIWAGRFLPPSDRANLDGPYYLGIWTFPSIQAYPAKFAGRDNGVAVWGQTGGGKFKYQFGAFEGCRGSAPCSTGSNDSNNPLFAGRLEYNFLDPEPGYYTSSDYYGSKDILALAAVIMYQKDATGTVALPGDYTAFSFDGLFQKKLSSMGVVSLEGAYYHYNLDHMISPLMGGEGFLLQGSYLFPTKIGMGQLQPVVRYQNMNRNDGGLDFQVYDFGLNYIISGHNARISVTGSIYNPDVLSSTFQAIVGLQLQL